MPRPSSRDRLASEALTLFEQHGYDNVTMAMIAEAAGVTERTAYRNYRNKLDVLMADFEQRTLEFQGLLYRQPLDLGVVDAVAKTARDGYFGAEELLALDLRRARIMMQVTELGAAWAEYEHEIEVQLGEWIAHRMNRSPFDTGVRVLAGALVVARRVAIQNWSLDPSRPLVDYSDEALAYVKEWEVGVST
ncbi:MAG: TetR/AcrR family transcriptional regulator [Actinomycetota bacterium]